LIFGACVGGRHSGVVTGLERTRPEEPAPASLEAAAQRYWTAKVAEDWDSVFDLEYEPEARASLVRDEFKNWSKEKEPFQIHSFKIERVASDGEMGWVELDYVTSIRRFPGLPPRDTKMVQKWRLTDDQWYPVPKNQLESYPEPPSYRDLAAEPRLWERFEGSWRARRAGDWSAMYEFTDPRDHGDVTLEMFAEAEGLFEYLDHKVHWVEVIGNLGQVRVAYRHKVTDKSMEKLAARDATIVERWVLYNDQWYRDLKWK